MSRLPSEDSYYTKNLMVKITEKQRQMLGVMVEVLGESRSEIVRRLLMEEAKKLCFKLEGEECELWRSLVNMIERDEDYHEIAVSNAIEEGRKRAFFERTGIELDDIKARKMSNDAIAQRNWHRKKRIEAKMKKIKMLDDKYRQKEDA